MSGWLVKIKASSIAEDVVSDPDVDLDDLALTLARSIDDATSAKVYLRSDGRLKVVLGHVAWLAPEAESDDWTVVVTSDEPSSLLSRSDVEVQDEQRAVSAIADALQAVDEVVDQM